MKNRTAALLTLALVPVSVLFAAPREANACGSAVRLEVKPLQKPTPVQQIARAERSLESGQTLAATKAVVDAFPKVRAAVAGRDPLETRAMRVFALALVRSDGLADEKKVGVKTSKEWTKDANLAWAVQALREIDQKRPNDPAVRADLGEALARTTSGAEEALTILAGLEKKDLMGSPHAYAALARLRERKGDTAGAEAAVKRCEEMTSAAGVCRPALPPPPPKPATTPAAKA